MNFILLSIAVLLSYSDSLILDLTDLRYVGYQFEETKNQSFLNKKMIFLDELDTLIVNLRLPYNIKTHTVIDKGVFYNCHLVKDAFYSIRLRRIHIHDIPKELNYYYNSNALPNEADSSRFIEIEKDTDFSYCGEYGMYVDINNTLYKIVGLFPDCNCFYPP
ncbi:hypothetical protein HMPREF1869_00957 [Bacteroidales bacterium KA00251]|nr:hypothetical protein HMPREF1869_00957 [Bacteroidales bacterium KA00251]